MRHLNLHVGYGVDLQVDDVRLSSRPTFVLPNRRRRGGWRNERRLGSGCKTQH
jgi:hypothetical protein